MQAEFTRISCGDRLCKSKVDTNLEGRIWRLFGEHTKPGPAINERI